MWKCSLHFDQCNYLSVSKKYIDQASAGLRIPSFVRWFESEEIESNNFQIYKVSEVLKKYVDPCMLGGVS